MKKYLSQSEYLSDLALNADVPAGFSVLTVPIEFFPREKKSDNPYQMNLSLISSQKPIYSFGAVFTRNQFPGAPVIIGKEMLGNDFVHGILINNRISNVCAPDGVAVGRRIADELAELSGWPTGSVFPSSTGIIGWSLPEHEMREALPRLVKSSHKGSMLKLAQSIMTTDSFPKMRSVKVGDGIISAVVKGAGMIEPNMATMLAFILTDLDVGRDLLRESLSEAVEQSFNRISIDSDQSTSDSVFILSSGEKSSVSKADFKKALVQLCNDLASDVVRNGEGTSHVMRVQINGFSDDLIAVGAAKAIVNSPLVKTALFGNDPNVGRFISALGDYCGNNDIELDRSSLSLTLGSEEVFRSGQFCLDEQKEDRLFHYLKEASLCVPSKGYPEHERFVEIKVSLKGRGQAVVLGSDLSYEYIRENAEYRS